MFINLGRRAKFFLVKDQAKENNRTIEAHVTPQLIPTSINSPKTPDEDRRIRNEFARLTQKEKAA